MGDAPPTSNLDGRSRQLRHLIVDGLAGGGRGHVGSALSLTEILRVLYDEILVYRASDPKWESRDRLILSKGHGCMALYALLVDKGFLAHEELVTFCEFESSLGGHPEFGRVSGVEASTGSLGHGLSVGVGMAMAARLKGAHHRVFVVLGDGELDEGSVWEAALAASHHRLRNLTVIVDHNALQSFGRLEEVWKLEPISTKWESFGFEACEVDGHDVGELRSALERPAGERPRVIVAHTVKGKGLPFAENDPAWHHKSKLTPEELATMRSALDNA